MLIMFEICVRIHECRKGLGISMLIYEGEGEGWGGTGMWLPYLLVVKLRVYTAKAVQI